MYVKFYFLIEDWSGSELIDALMKKIQATGQEFDYEYKHFGGLGGFSKSRTPKEEKNGRLLNDLPIYLRGFNKKLSAIPKEAGSFSLFIVLDNDTRETANFQSQLQQIAVDNGITIDHAFCIAVEEMEAWLLGDLDAVITAYPNAKKKILNSYEQDSVCGTWELLADAVYPGGHEALKKEGYARIGQCKGEWARKIGALISLDKDKSPSFQNFLSAVYQRLPDAPTET